MPSFRAGIGVGILLGAGFTSAFWVASEASGAPALAPDTPEAAPAAPPAVSAAAAQYEPVPARSPVPPPPRAEAHADPAAGECTVRIGDGYIFGEQTVRGRDEREQVDLYCQDIREEVSLHCPHGAAEALAPLTAIGLPQTATAAAALLVDAPTTIAPGDLWLRSRPEPRSAGLGIVRSHSGVTFKVWLVEVTTHADALERAARIRYAPVPQVDGGGALDLPRIQGAPPAKALQLIRTALEMGKRIPNQGFHSYLAGDFSAVEEPGPETSIGPGAHNVVFGLLSDQKITATAQAAVFAERLGPNASILLEHGGAGVIGSDLEGLLRTDGYAYLFVGGDVTGTLDIRSYTTAVVMGDVRGRIRVGSYTDLYVRGRILGALDTARSGWSRFYFQSFMSRADLERLSGNHQITVHLRLSDLLPGKHNGIGEWGDVIVGDPIWQTLAR